YPLNTGSTLRTSGSVKYVVGAPPGPKSRGGFVTVLGGVAGRPGVAWARATRGATAATPATVPRGGRSVRRDIGPLWSRAYGSGAMVDPPRLRGRTVSEPAGHVDGHPGDEVGVAGGQEADHPRLVARVGDTSQRRARDLARLLLRRPLLPAWPDPLGQREAGGDRVDADPEGPQLVSQLPREGDDPTLRGGVGAAAALAEPPPCDGRDVHDLAAPLALHDRRHRVAEEERALEVERDETLPLGERELVDRGRRPRDHRAPPDRVDQDVDASELTDDAVHQGADLPRIQRVGPACERSSPRRADSEHRRVEPCWVSVHADDDPAFATDDVGRGAADPARRRSDERHLVAESRLGCHAIRPAMMPVRNTPSKVPAPPMETMGAPSSAILPRLRRSAPIRVPIDPDTYATGGALRKARSRPTPAATSGGTSIGTAMPKPGTIRARLCTTAATIATPTSMRQ